MHLNGLTGRFGPGPAAEHSKIPAKITLKLLLKTREKPLQTRPQGCRFLCSPSLFLQAKNRQESRAQQATPGFTVKLALLTFRGSRETPWQIKEQGQLRRGSCRRSTLDGSSRGLIRDTHGQLPESVLKAGPRRKAPGDRFTVLSSGGRSSGPEGSPPGINSGRPALPVQLWLQ